MRRLSATLLVALVISLGPPSVAHAAEMVGTITGRALNASTGEPEAGVRITLSASRTTGTSTKSWNMVTDDRGRYYFEGLPAGEEWIYAVDGRHDGGLFSGRPLTIPAQKPPPVIQSTLKVWDTTSDPSAIHIVRDDLFVTPFEGGLSVLESVLVTNTSGRAYVGRGRSIRRDARGANPTLGFALPNRADSVSIYEADIDIPEVISQSYGFAATVAIPPRDTRLTFAYRVPASGGGLFDLTRSALYPTASLSVYATEPLTIESDRLSEAGRATIDGKRYTRWSSEDGFAAGDQIPAGAIAQAGSSVGLVAGVGALIVVLGAGLLLALRRRRDRAPARPAEPASSTAEPASATAESVRSGRARSIESARRGESTSLPIDPARPADPAPRLEHDRAELLDAIARLDLDHEDGKLGAAEWMRRRAALKARLAGSRRAAAERSE